MSHYKMICPECKEKGLKSQVKRYRAYSVVAVAYPEPFWDEEGKYHDFTPPKQPDFVCTHGHTFDDPEYWRTPVPL